MFKALNKFSKYIQLVSEKIAFESRSISFYNSLFNRYTFKCPLTVTVVEFFHISAFCCITVRIIWINIYTTLRWYLVQSKLSIKYNLEIIIIFAFNRNCLLDN